MAISKAEGAIEGAICRRFLCLREKSTKLWVWGRLKHLFTLSTHFVVFKSNCPIRALLERKPGLWMPITVSWRHVRISQNPQTKTRAKRAFQKVYWHGSFNLTPSLYGRGGYYVGVPMREDQDTTVSTSLCRMCQTSAELSPKIHEKKHPKRYFDMPLSTLHLLYMIGESSSTMIQCQVTRTRRYWSWYVVAMMRRQQGEWMDRRIARREKAESNQSWKGTIYKHTKCING